MAAKTVLRCPPDQQSLKWNDEQKMRYYIILKKADKVRISPQYTKSCMLDRNRHMVDHSGYLICYLRQNTGGTFYTVNHAGQCGSEIIRL